MKISPQTVISTECESAVQRTRRGTADSGGTSKGGQTPPVPTQDMHGGRASTLPRGLRGPGEGLEAKMKDISEALAMALLYAVFAASAILAAIVFRP